MKVYIINVNEAVESGIARKLISNGFDIMVFEKITNIPGIAAISGDSTLIIGDEYRFDEPNRLFNKMATISDNPVVLLASNSETETNQIEENDNITALNSKTDFFEDLISFIKSKRKLKVKKFQINRENLSLNVDSRIFTIMEVKVYLTNTEFNIMHYILASESMNISHKELMLVFQAKRKKININTLANHIRNINKKAQAASGQDKLIKSLYGFGYGISATD